MAALAEPTVLATAKDTLYPHAGPDETAYAVTDTQFTVDTWGSQPVPQSIRDRLAPFNCVQFASGRPDLVGAGMPATEVREADVTNAVTPVVVVEAKGVTDGGSVDVERGIVQAHSRLPEANLAYAAVPGSAIDQSARSLARELNVGLVAVDDFDAAAVVETPRVVGVTDFSPGVDAIRSQATAHGLTDGSFPLNHPKNYLAVPVAVAAQGETSAIYETHVVRESKAAMRGAQLLGLVVNAGDGYRLTDAGAEVVRFARRHHGSMWEALEEFDDWSGSRERFTELHPAWGELARSVLMQYDAAQLVVRALESLHRDGVHRPSLPEVATTACDLNPALAVEVFFTPEYREDVLTPEGGIDASYVELPQVYKSGAYFQFKAMLYHVGLITSGGEDDAQDAVEDVWELENPVGTGRTQRWG